MIDDDYDDFIKLINPKKTQIKAKLPFIWVFGAGGDEIRKIEQIKDPLSPGHEDFVPYENLSSFRSRFIQWSKTSKHEISDKLSVPESYPDWLYFDNYSNLVDFELDISAISEGIIIFSESIGAYTEIGMFSCVEELHKNILIISKEKHINESNASFFNYGAISKIKKNSISEETTNIWALENDCDHNIQKESLDELFLNISNHFLDIITHTQNSKVSFNNENKYHIMLLTIDLVDLFPSKSKTFYKKILSYFEIDINNNEITKILKTLKILKIISSKQSGNNTFYRLEIDDYKSCIDYQADHPKKFERSDFKLKSRK